MEVLVSIIQSPEVLVFIFGQELPDKFIGIVNLTAIRYNDECMEVLVHVHFYFDITTKSVKSVRCKTHRNSVIRTFGHLDCSHSAILKLYISAYSFFTNFN